MTAPPASPITLLKALRNLLALEVSAQVRLDRITQWVAEQMRVDVCSIYLRLPDNSFELCAAEGLAPSAVHRTRMKADEGIIGHIATIASPYQSENVRDDPYFSYRPETEEDRLQSFMGVPLQRAGKLIGIIAIQSVEKRTFNLAEEETLLTVAMLLAEFLAAEHFLSRVVNIRGSSSQDRYFKGNGVVAGLSVGKALVRRSGFVFKDFVATDPVFERERFHDALARLEVSLERPRERARRLKDDSLLAILDTHSMMSRDPVWRKGVFEKIDSGLTVEASLGKELESLQARFRAMDNTMIQQRLHDIEDMSVRLLRIVRGEEWSFNPDQLPDNPVLVAQHLGPAELLDFSDLGLVGLVIEEGAATSHTAIIARALGLPMICNVTDFTNQIEMGQQLMLDGEQGLVIVDPDKDELHTFEQRVKRSEDNEKRFFADRDLPCETRDGVSVRLNITAGLRSEIGALEDVRAEGIGLFRTELDFLIAERLPKRQRQQAFYRTILDEAAGKKVIFRTLDIGSDKVLSYIERDHEENPALGLRAIRLALARPALLSIQAQALLAASSGQSLSVMFPMIASREEFLAARSLCEQERAKLIKRGVAVADEVHYGAMIEVPSLLYDLDGLLSVVDFISVGSNDFHQYFWAADRSNSKVSNVYDELEPVFLRALQTIARACQTYQKPFGLCGEMASRPLAAVALVGLGWRDLSAVPRDYGRVKAAIRSVDSREVSALVDDALAGKMSASQLKESLAALLPDYILF